MRKVFKFGGASVANVESIRNVAQIINQYKNHPLTVVVSAMGKTTNALESVVDAYINHQEQAATLSKEIKENHLKVCEDLLSSPNETKDKINNFFVEIDWLLEDKIESDYDYVYDQIVSIGELASTTILADYLKELGINSIWYDAREIIHTDDFYREATINWEKTENAIQNKLQPLLDDDYIIITQGFIGSTSDNNTTTLGREGSDFTGAILSNCLDAESLTIWKDVPGVLNADPRWKENTIKLENMNYREAVEQTFYGAKVIHPKTIKPLQNKGIPLHVRSFLHPNEIGTTIQNQEFNQFDQPIYILKRDQVLLKCVTKDFSFFDNQHLSHVAKIFKQEHCDINLLQAGAIQCSFVFDNEKDMIDAIHQQLEDAYNIELEFELELLTLRHYNEAAIQEEIKDKICRMQQKSPITFQVLYRI